VSDVGLPGLGLRLGVELLRGPNGIWFSGTAADGRTVGVLRLDPDRMKAPGMVERLVDRTVAARAGLLPGVLPVLDLVEDAGRIWLITAAVPVAETATRTEAMLLAADPEPAASPTSANVWRPQIVLRDQAAPIPPPPSGGPVGDAPVAKSGGGRRIAVWAVVAVVVVGAAAVLGLKLRSGGGEPPALQLAAVSVQAPAGVTPTSICHASLDMVAVLATNGGQGAFDYEWDLPKTTPVAASATVSGPSPQRLHLTWQLQLTGSGTVTAVFRAKPGPAVPGGRPLQGSLNLPYACP
jgi:hypothetical protein